MTQPVDFLDIFVQSPGDLLYFFTIIALSLTSLFLALGQRLRYPGDMIAHRYTLGLIGVVSAWAILLAGAMAVIVTDENAVRVLPPLERYAMVVSIVLLTWAFITVSGAVQAKRPTRILGLALLGLTAAYAISAVYWWDRASEEDFAISSIGAIWTVVAVFVSLSGFFFVLGNLRRVVDAPLKVLVYAVLLIGFGATLARIVQGEIVGDYAGASRIAFVLALALTPVLIYRAIVLQLGRDVASVKASLQRALASAPAEPLSSQADFRHSEIPPPLSSPVERESVKLLRALGLILEDATPERIPKQVVNAVIEVVKVDVAVLLRMQDANYADVIAAYDNVLEREINGVSINLDHQPTLVDAIQRHQQRLLDLDSNADELQDLYTRLDIRQTGPVYFQPLIRAQELVAILMVATPYTGRDLPNAEREMLKGIAVIAGNLLGLSFDTADARMLAEERAIQAMVQSSAPLVDDEAAEATRKELQNRLKVARDQIGELSRQVMQLKVELDDERSRVAADLGDTNEGLSVSQRIITLADKHDALLHERDALAQRLQEAEAALQGAVATDDASLYNEMIATLQRDREELSAEKRRLQQQLDNLRAQDRAIAPDDMQVLIENMMAENTRLEIERDRAQSKLVDVQSQLMELGLDDDSGSLVQFISKLNEQRLLLQSENMRVKGERDRLLEERQRYAGDIDRQSGQAERLQMLEKTLNNLAGDREVAVKQRDKVRAERDELAEKLDAVKRHRARLLAQNTGYDIELREAHDAEAKLHQQIEALSNERSTLIRSRDRLEAEKQAAETERDQLLARSEGNRERLQELGTSGVGSLTGIINELTEERSTLEQQLNQASTQISALENELEALKMRVESDGQEQQRYQPNDADLLLGLVQELRTPMTSIIGYVDLLLGESAGILGEMQRKFLQRVSTNVNRLGSMLEDLVHVAELDAGTFPFVAAPVDVLNLIEDAITNASVQFREKGLAINLNLAENLPLVHADKDAISQVFWQLLTNAYLVSPPNSEVTITATRNNFSLSPDGETVAVRDCVYIAVSDRGGGIAPEDEPRVFARKYKAENPLIQGLGDTGVGLSIAKTLVEAHGGRLWLESQEHMGTMFYFILPIDAVNEPEQV